MTLIMTLLVRNEQDILRANLDFHLAQGVDRFLVMDHRSEDGTGSILREYADRGVAEIIPQHSEGYYQGEWVTQMARNAANGYGADWVINGDADEFWWPTEGTLATFFEGLAEDVDVVLVGRHNFLPLPDPGGDPTDEMVYRYLESTNSMGAPLPDKAAHRGDPDVVVAQGNHDATSPNFRRRIRTDGIEILHYPVRSLAQIEGKIALGGRAYAMSPEIPAQWGATWRLLHRQLTEGGLEDYFRSECMAAPGVPVSRDGRQLVQDTRLRDFLRALRS